MPKQVLNLFKIGGKIIDQPEKRAKFLKGFSELPGPKILVHGGGVIAEEMARKLNIPTEMRGGRRVTSKAMRDLVTMVYGGGINKSIVAELQAFGCDAIGLTGADAGFIQSKKRAAEPIDFGYVGDVVSVRADLLAKFLQLGLCPVFAPLTYDHEILNTNADGVASALASSLSAFHEVHLLYAFEAPGVMLDVKDPSSLIRELNYLDYEKYLAKEVFTEGMLPKLEECFRAMKKGVKDVILADESNCLAASLGQSYRGTRLTLD